MDRQVNESLMFDNVFPEEPWVEKHTEQGFEAEKGRYSEDLTQSLIG